MPPRRRILPTLEVLDQDDERETETRAGEPDADECLFCTLVDEAEDEAQDVPDGDRGDDELRVVVRDKLAIAHAYGAVVFSQDHGVATCDECNEAIETALRDLKKELRKVRRPRARSRG
jgi:hypothetical protein